MENAGVSTCSHSFIERVQLKFRCCLPDTNSRANRKYFHQIFACSIYGKIDDCTVLHMLNLRNKHYKLLQNLFLYSICDKIKRLKFCSTEIKQTKLAKRQRIFHYGTTKSARFSYFNSRFDFYNSNLESFLTYLRMKEQ